MADLESGGQRILNPCDIEKLPHITDCKTELYAKSIFGISFYVSILTLNFRPISEVRRYIFRALLAKNGA